MNHELGVVPKITLSGTARAFSVSARVGAAR